MFKKIASSAQQGSAGGDRVLATNENLAGTLVERGDVRREIRDVAEKTAAMIRTNRNPGGQQLVGYVDDLAEREVAPIGQSVVG